MRDELAEGHPQAMFFDTVTLKSRTGKSETFQYDSLTYTVGAKGIHVPRHLADRAVKQHALEWNPGTGAVINSKLYIDEDEGTPEETPRTPLSDEDIVGFKNTDGLGDDTILIDGKPVKKHTIDFRNKYEEKDFSKNNQL